jgi:hypothetical protein
MSFKVMMVSGPSPIHGTAPRTHDAGLEGYLGGDDGGGNFTISPSMVLL